uniref:Uncharacterized protein n=1 Tax=Arundo donax TaxID=35708 RepID=A0A0A9F207_ARUDO
MRRFLGAPASSRPALICRALGAHSSFPDGKSGHVQKIVSSFFLKQKLIATLLI